MALDPTLADAVGAYIRSGDDAIGATLRATADLAATLRGLEDELLAARAIDLEDVGGRIARRLAGVVADSDLPGLAAGT